MEARGYYGMPGPVLELSLDKPALSSEASRGVGSFPVVTRKDTMDGPSSVMLEDDVVSGALGKVLCFGIFSFCSLMPRLS